jgi:transposase-like protein
VSIVWAWGASVAEYVAAGQQVVTPVPTCPSCRRRLGKWSGYWRWVRYPQDERRIWIRRTRCRPCRSSHALLPDFLFVRRLDDVASIGQVLALRATVGVELRALARRFDLPRATLRGWWDRFRARSPTLLAEMVVEVAIGLDPAPLDLRQKSEAAVFEALEQTLNRAGRRFGEQRVGDVWRFWSRISGGQVLATNTSAS